MRPRFSPVVFSIGYCCGYALEFRWNLPLFRYYPVPHQWAWGATDEIVRPGPPIVWYGLVASASLVAAAASIIAAGVTMMATGRANRGERLPLPTLHGWFWLGPWLAAAYCAFLLRLFFR